MAIPFLVVANGGLARATSDRVLLHGGPEAMFMESVDIHFGLFFRATGNNCFALFMDIEHEFSGFFEAVAK